MHDMFACALVPRRPQWSTAQLESRPNEWKIQKRTHYKPAVWVPVMFRWAVILSRSIDCYRSAPIPKNTNRVKACNLRHLQKVLLLLLRLALVVALRRTIGDHGWRAIARGAPADALVKCCQWAARSMLVWVCMYCTYSSSSWFHRNSKAAISHKPTISNDICSREASYRATMHGAVKYLSLSLSPQSPLTCSHRHAA